MGRLTTHVLDTSAGRPAAGVRITLRRCGAQGPEILATVATNADGRCDAPLLEGPALTEDIYELTFAVGAYFGTGTFLDEVPVRFRVEDAEQHYHIPLLIAPYGYSTYRGS